jgi:glycosyltransferase involved in cell wall biosynthesis
VALGSDGDDGPGACACPALPGTGRGLPALVEEQLVLAEGGDAPTLYEHLRGTPYDATLFVGLHSPATYFGLRALPDGRRAFLVPAHHDATLGPGVHDRSLERAERILVCTETERRRMAARLGSGGTDRVENVGFLLGVNTVVRPDEPAGGEGRFVVVARDWRTSDSLGRYRPWSEQLARHLPGGVSLRLVGPGATFVPHGVPHTDARIDAWWWMSRALAVIDPAPHRVIGQEVLEALLLGVPTVVAANGDATREHAEVSNGGLWYRAEDELLASIDRLRDRDLGSSLGEQGRSYVLSRHADTDTYVKGLADVVLG